MSAYRWPQVNVWYCGHCGANLGTDSRAAKCSHCTAKHAFMIEKTEYLDIGAPNATNSDGRREATPPVALLESGEQRPDVDELPKEG